MNILFSAQNTWLGFSEGFWGAVIGAAIPVLAGIVGVIVTGRKEKVNKNVRTFSKINYELNKFINTVKNYEYHEQEVAIKLEKKCSDLVEKFSNLNIDILDANEVKVFYEILNIIDDIGESTYEEEEIRDDCGRLQDYIPHTTPELVSKKLNELESKRRTLIKEYL